MRSACGDNEDEKKKVRENLEPRSAHGRAVNKENEDHIEWSGLGFETGYHYLIDVYNMDEQRILA